MPGEVVPLRFALAGVNVERERFGKGLTNIREGREERVEPVADRSSVSRLISPFPFG